MLLLCCFFLQSHIGQTAYFHVCFLYLSSLMRVQESHCTRLSTLLPLFCDISQKCQTICSKQARTPVVLKTETFLNVKIGMATNTETCSLHVINVLLHVHKTNLFIPIKCQILWHQKSAGQATSNTTGYSISCNKLSNCQKVTLQ